MPPKFESYEAPVAEQSPHRCFGVGRLATHAFGEMADALLLASARVEPAKLVASRFVFRHKDLDATLEYLLA